MFKLRWKSSFASFNSKISIIKVTLNTMRCMHRVYETSQWIIHFIQIVCNTVEIPYQTINRSQTKRVYSHIYGWNKNNNRSSSHATNEKPNKNTNIQTNCVAMRCSRRRRRRHRPRMCMFIYVDANILPAIYFVHIK